MHQQPDGEGDIEAAFGDLGLHFLSGDGRRTLAWQSSPGTGSTLAGSPGDTVGKVCFQNRFLRVGQTPQSSQKTTLDQGIR